MSEPSEITVICSECGKRISEGNVFVLGDPKGLDPIFCSKRCVENFKPHVLTFEKLSSIAGRLPSKKPYTTLDAVAREGSHASFARRI